MNELEPTDWLLVLRELPVDPNPTPPPVKLKPPPVELPWPEFTKDPPPPLEEDPMEEPIEDPMEEPIEDPLEEPIEDPLELRPEEEVPWAWEAPDQIPSNPRPISKPQPFFKGVGNLVIILSSHSIVGIGSIPRPSIPILTQYFHGGNSVVRNYHRLLMVESVVCLARCYDILMIF